MSHLGTTQIPVPENDPVLGYEPGSPERASLKAELDRQASTTVEVPLRIGGQKIFTGNTLDMVMPHDHRHVLGKVHQAGPEEVSRAIEAAKAAKLEWANMPHEARIGVFTKAAHLLRTSWRDRVNAATMLNISKVVFQAEIDAACELIDFLNFNAYYLGQIYEDQPLHHPDGIWNRLEYRPLDGFVFAVTPFNFTAIQANIAAAPAMCGNTVVWKPAPNAILSTHYVMDLLEEAGLPAGVINYVPGEPAAVGGRVMDDPDFGGLHFTGSTDTFQLLWRQAAENLHKYRSYPRIVGETGGKDFIMVHPSADDDQVFTAMIRGAFEFQGQKCSAASRAYIPASMWGRLRDRLADELGQIPMGDVRDFRNLMGAVIDERAFDKHAKAITQAKEQTGGDVEEVLGGEFDASKGYFVRPTIVVSNTPNSYTMVTELFGPVLTVYVYEDAKWSETLELCDQTSPYGLTGAVFSRERAPVVEATEKLRFAAGNFYVNDKPTGAVVGQQPFGGGRKSGTNDKAGAPLNLLRWISPRTIKENFAPPTNWRYSYMREE